MKQFTTHIIFLFFLCSASIYAQLDSIQQLPEVILTDAKLVHFSDGFKLEKLNDSVLKRNSASLGEALRYNASIYFKENGFGMVSSPSFRGTNAAQTAVIWNGININSVFTGQTDFNTISPLNYNQILVRSGGGGVQYGSGAVGGSIHLNNTFTFREMDTTTIGLRAGSFLTLGSNFSTTHSWGVHYLNVAADFISSKNDYEYVGKNRKNKHGEYVRFTAKINEARKLKNGVASWNSEYSYNNRNFSGSLNTIGKNAYKDIATRNLWQLRQEIGAYSTKASVAHLFEQYHYFPDSEKSLHDGGKANTFISAFQAETFFFEKLRVNGKLEYSYVTAEGSNVGKHNRKTLATVFLMNHTISSNFSYGLNFRKEFLNDFNNPLLFSADMKWQLIDGYALRLNGSRNYRVPTFNDLFWYAGGNSELKPETSYQMELGQEFQIRKLKIDLAFYYISSKDLIKWIPTNSGIWEPVNISKTRNYGAEVALDYSVLLSRWHELNFSVNYAYTNAEDLQKHTQLIYVPFHKGFGVFQYNFKTFSAYVQGLYTGEVYTTTDNAYTVNAYQVFNFGAAYTFPLKPEITFGGRLKNVFNVYYENVAYRPMPPRNFEIYLNFNI